MKGGHSSGRPTAPVQAAAREDRELASALRQMDQWAQADADGGAAYWQGILQSAGSIEVLEAWVWALGTELRSCPGSFEETTGCRRVIRRESSALEGCAIGAGTPSDALDCDALLFLDFDGTTHPDGCSANHYFSRLELLEPWLRQRPGVRIVISSSWREARSLDELRSFFAEDLRARVLGVTPIAARSDWAFHQGELLPIRFEREAEILAWLRTHATGQQRWAALDDQAWRFRPFCKQLVLCDPGTGLTEHELDRLDRVLRLEPGRPG